MNLDKCILECSDTLRIGIYRNYKNRECLVSFCCLDKQAIINKYQKLPFAEWQDKWMENCSKCTKAVLN